MLLSCHIPGGSCLSQFFQQSQSGFGSCRSCSHRFPLPTGSSGWWNRDGNTALSHRVPTFSRRHWREGLFHFCAKVHGEASAGCGWDTSCRDPCGDRRGCPSAWPGRPARPALLRATLTLGSRQQPVHQPCRSPGVRVCRCPQLPCGRSPLRNALQQERCCLGQDLLQPLPLPGAERSQDMAGHCHFTLRLPDANSKPGHLLQREESWRSFTSGAETELGRRSGAASGAGQRGNRPLCFPGGFSACSKKHDFGRGFCWAVLRPRAPARPGRAARANCFHVLHSSQTDISPQRRRKGREEREQRLV